ncbi:MAG: 50S ribosomal protein L29 [Acidobacteria bacterium]|nr:50S ribosomal protein L29 [Acidobacteriota bacterium]
MKPNEVRGLNDDALFARGAELREKLFRLRFKAALGNTDTVNDIRQSRKDLARIKTEVRTRELRNEAAEGGKVTGKMSRAKRRRRAEARHNAQARS